MNVSAISLYANGRAVTLINLLTGLKQVACSFGVTFIKLLGSPWYSLGCLWLAGSLLHTSPEHLLRFPVRGFPRGGFACCRGCAVGEINRKWKEKLLFLTGRAVWSVWLFLYLGKRLLMTIFFHRIQRTSNYCLRPPPPSHPPPSSAMYPLQKLQHFTLISPPQRDSVLYLLWHSKVQ